MPITYTQDDGMVDGLVSQVMSDYHLELQEAGVTVLTMFAHGPRSKETGELTGPALSNRGYPLLARIKVNSLKDRVAGLADATLIIDADNWKELGPAEREALVDHELEHLAATENVDDIGRPKLKTRPHDFESGGFYKICERHGAKAIEAQQVGNIVAGFKERQLVFPWG